VHCKLFQYNFTAAKYDTHANLQKCSYGCSYCVWTVLYHWSINRSNTYYNIQSVNLLKAKTWRPVKLQYTVVLYSATTIQRFTAPWTLSVTTRVSQFQKGKTNLDLLDQEIVNGSGISWAICKSASRPSQITMPASHRSVFSTQSTASKHWRHYIQQIVKMSLT